MKIKAVLFDLDGTLLPMDQDTFVKAYFKGLATKLAPIGYDPQLLIKGIWAGTQAMVENDGSATNEEVFWKVFCSICGKDCRKDEAVFADFYKNEFQQVKDVCGYAPEAAKIIAKLHDAGITTVLATNPIFPAIATESRMKWAGLAPSDFVIYTTYEASRYSKPNPKYYLDILDKLGLEPHQCAMVGNDVGDDMGTKDLGMQVFLLTNDLINKENVDISQYPNGDYAALNAWLDTLIQE